MKLSAESGAGAPLPRWVELGRGCPPVLRLGLATAGKTQLAVQDVACVAARGVNYFNWCGYDDGLAGALRQQRIDRRQVVVAMQLESRDAISATQELEQSFRTLSTHWIDVVTFYYVERES